MKNIEKFSAKNFWARADWTALFVWVFWFHMKFVLWDFVAAQSMIVGQQFSSWKSLEKMFLKPSNSSPNLLDHQLLNLCDRKLFASFSESGHVFLWFLIPIRVRQLPQVNIASFFGWFNVLHVILSHYMSFHKFCTLDLIFLMICGI